MKAKQQVYRNDSGKFQVKGLDCKFESECDALKMAVNALGIWAEDEDIEICRRCDMDLNECECWEIDAIDEMMREEW